MAFVTALNADGAAKDLAVFSTPSRADLEAPKAGTEADEQ
jgi:hypothetical protein